jgi:branched-chain amino acid transport system substrate-binding protein
MTLPLSRRKLITSAAAMLPFVGPWKHNRVYASTAHKPVRIGLLHSATGQYGVSGAAEKRGTITAIEEANAGGGVLGRPIEYVWTDTKTDPDVARQVAARFIVENEVSFLAGAVHSNVAKAVAEVAQRFGCVYLNTNSSAPSQSAEDCHRVKFVFDANGRNFALATANYVTREYGRNWLLLINDYSWGHQTAAAIRTISKAAGANIIDEILVPVGTRNYIGILKKISARQPDVVATAIGGDDYIPLRAQAVDLGLHKRPAWLNNQQDWPDHFAINQASLFGVFGTTWYHGLDLPGVTDFVQSYRKRWPDSSIDVPGNVYYNGYMAMKSLLDAVERAGTTNNLAVIKQMETIRVSARDRMQHHEAYMDADSHHMQQTVYIASNNDEPKLDRDFYRILAAIPPQEVTDSGESNCQLESYAETPVYEL